MKEIIAMVKYKDARNRLLSRTLTRDIVFLNPDYVIGFLRPDKVRGDACPVFTGSVAIARKSGCLEILA